MRLYMYVFTTASQRGRGLPVTRSVWLVGCYNPTDSGTAHNAAPKKQWLESNEPENRGSEVCDPSIVSIRCMSVLGYAFRWHLGRWCASTPQFELAHSNLTAISAGHEKVGGKMAEFRQFQQTPAPKPPKLPGDALCSDWPLARLWLGRQAAATAGASRLATAGAWNSMMTATWCGSSQNLCRGRSRKVRSLL